MSPECRNEDLPSHGIHKDIGIGTAVKILGQTAPFAHIHDGSWVFPCLATIRRTGQPDVHMPLQVAPTIIAHVVACEKGSLVRLCERRNPEGVAIVLALPMDDDCWTPKDFRFGVESPSWKTFTVKEG